VGAPVLRAAYGDALGGSRLWTGPTLGETNADYKRFSGNDIFAIYRQLKNQRDGAGSFEAEQASKAKRLVAVDNRKEAWI
jgi:hypothetical protein